MIAVWVLVLLFFFHWLSDFVFQPHWMSLNKSKSWYVLGQHSFRIWYGSLLAAAIIATIHAGGFTWGWGPMLFALINGIGHFGIDAVTSRITAKLYAQNKIHDFFVVIGFDQFLHMALAVLTLAWLVV